MIATLEKSSKDFKYPHHNVLSHVRTWISADAQPLCLSKSSITRHHLIYTSLFSPLLSPAIFAYQALMQFSFAPSVFSHLSTPYALQSSPLPTVKQSLCIPNANANAQKGRRRKSNKANITLQSRAPVYCASRKNRSFCGFFVVLLHQKRCCSSLRWASHSFGDVGELFAHH